MSRSETAYGAYGGVELRLANDVVHMVDDLTVAEALRFLRVFEGAAEDLRILYLFLREFIPRLGLGDFPLADVGLNLEITDADADIEGVDLSAFSELGKKTTVLEALDMCEALWAAQEIGDAIVVLEEFPKLFGVDPDAVRPADIFAAARAFVLAFYAHWYGLAETFLSHLVAGPAIQVMILQGLPTRASSTLVSTT